MTLRKRASGLSSNHNLAPASCFIVEKIINLAEGVNIAMSPLLGPLPSHPRARLTTASYFPVDTLVPSLHRLQ